MHRNGYFNWHLQGRIANPLMILFIQSIVVLRNYSIVLKLFYLLQFFPEVAQNSRSFQATYGVSENNI